MATTPEFIPQTTEEQELRDALDSQFAPGGVFAGIDKIEFADDSGAVRTRITPPGLSSANAGALDDTQTTNNAPADSLDFDAVWTEGLEEDMLHGAVANKYGLPPILAKDAVAADGYDRAVWDAALETSPGLQKMIRDDAKTIPTIDELAPSIFQAVKKDNPRLRAPEEMDPEYKVNSYLIDQIVNTPDYHTLRASGTIGDDFVSTIAARSLATGLIKTMTPEIKKALKEAHKAGEKANDARAVLDVRSEDADAAAQSEDDARDAAFDASGTADQAAAQAALAAAEEANYDAQQAIEQARAAHDALAVIAARAAAEAAESVDTAGAEIRAAIRAAIGDAVQEIEELGAVVSLFGGTGLGTGKGGNVQEKLDLLKRVQGNDRLRKIAEIGRVMVNKATYYQSKRVRDIPDDVHDVVVGNDLSLILPSELQRFVNPLTRPLFFRDFVNEDLLQMRPEGKQKQGQGPIIITRDNSASMTAYLNGYTREIWSKGLSMALLKIALKQRRDALVVDYDDARDAEDCTQWVFSKDGYDTNEVLTCCLHFTQGGTVYDGWMMAALDAIESSQWKKADIIHLSDGEAGVSSATLNRWNKVKAAKGFRCFTIYLGSRYSSYGYTSILDSFSDVVVDVNSLSQAEEAFSQVFSI